MKHPVNGLKSHLATECRRLLVAPSLFLAGSITSAQGNVDLASLSLNELMEVEVTTPGKVPEAIRDTPASVYLISREDIETYGYSNLTEVFESVPGFYNIDNYNGVSGNFGVRGYWNGRSQNGSLAILINGIPQSRPDVFSNPMETLNIAVEAIDRIEISRGPNSVIYGNGASFGAINIITDASFDSDQFSVSYGSNDTVRAAGRTATFGEDFHVIVNAGYSETDGYDYDLLDMVGDDRVGLLPNYGIDESNTSFEGRLEQKSKHVQLSSAWKNYSLEIFRINSDTETYTGFPSVEEGNIRDEGKTQVSLGMNLPIAGEYTLDTRLTYLDYSSDSVYDALYPGFIGSNSLSFTNWELESLLSYDPSTQLKFIAGVNLQRLKGLHEFTHLPDLGILNESVVINKRDTHSIFGQVSYDVNEAVRLVAGYRFEEMGDFERYIYVDEPVGGEYLPNPYKGGFKNGTPRFSLIYQPSESQVLKFMIGDAVKIPSFSDTGFESEKTRTVEVNYTWAVESFMVSASLFKNSMSNLLIDEFVIPPGGVGVVDFELRTGGEVDTTGVEFLVRSDFTDTLSAELGLTMQDSEDSSNPTGLLSYSPELVGHMKFSYQKGDFSFAATGHYVDEMWPYYSNDASGLELAPDGYFGEPTDAYSVVDLNVRLDDVWAGLFLQLKVSNVFDTEIRYPSNPVNGLLLNRGTIGPDRGFVLKAGYEF